MAVYYTGLDVRYGNSYQMSFTTTQYKDADWLDANAPRTDTDFAHWDLNNVIQNWDADDRPTQPQDRKDYFDTVEHNLNVAVYYCASAINFLISEYSGCGCDGPKKPLQHTMRKWSSTYLLLFSWLALGSMSFLMSLGISKFMELVVVA